MKKLSDRARGYGIPGISVDGMDAVAVAEAANEAIARARQGGGPTLLEGRTYRYYGHGPYDSGASYRSQEEVERWKQKDSINKLYTYLLKERMITEEENRDIDTKLAQELDEAVKFALESPAPGVEEVWRDIYFQRLGVGTGGGARLDA